MLSHGDGLGGTMAKNKQDAKKEPSSGGARPQGGPQQANRKPNGVKQANKPINRGGGGGRPASPGPSRAAPGGAKPSAGSRPQGPAARPGGGGARPPARGGVRVGPEPSPVATKEAVAPVSALELPETITVRELAHMMRRSPIEIIKVLMNYGIMASINQTIDFDTAAIVGEEMGIQIKPIAPPVVEEPQAAEPAAPKTLRQRLLEGESPTDLVPRPPIVTVLGHVDHGKTTLLDAIRRTRVAEGESGGITQHIGAYQVEIHGRKITFLDTPGHEAFTAMRARGAQATDIAVLVVAADDGVMPQTREAVDHARAAQVPIIVALNKIDKPTAQPERVMKQLSELGLVAEAWGGDTIIVPVSAKQKQGIEELLENILLVTDVVGVKANPKKPAVGTVIEAKLDRTRGPSATLLVLNGTLRVGDSLVLGHTWGRVRAMYDDRGNQVNEAPPSMPVVVVGLSEVPSAGDTFEVVEDERVARAIAAERAAARQATAEAAPVKAVTLESLMEQIKADKAKELTIILKADVQGSLEPIASQLTRLGDEKLKVKILHQGIGSVSESDVMLAIASQAVIVGFNVDVDTAARRLAENQGVDIRLYDVIYHLVEDMDKALKGLLEPVYQEVVIGHAEVRQVFKVRTGKVAGSYVTDGVVTRNALARIRRDGNEAYKGRVASLRRFTEDVEEVKANMECGIALEGFEDYVVGDVIEFYKRERVR